MGQSGRHEDAIKKQAAFLFNLRPPPLQAKAERRSVVRATFLTNTTATPATNTTSSISSNSGGGSPLTSTTLSSLAISSCPVRSFLREQNNQNKQKMSTPPAPVAAGSEAYIETDPAIVSPVHSYVHACTNAHQLADAGSDYDPSG